LTRFFCRKFSPLLSEWMRSPWFCGPALFSSSVVNSVGWFDLAGLIIFFLAPAPPFLLPQVQIRALKSGHNPPTSAGRSAVFFFLTFLLFPFLIICCRTAPHQRLGMVVNLDFFLLLSFFFLRDSSANRQPDFGWRSFLFVRAGAWMVSLPGRPLPLIGAFRPFFAWTLVRIGLFPARLFPLLCDFAFVPLPASPANPATHFSHGARVIGFPPSHSGRVFLL